jgi:hypothetical protein
MYHFCLRFSIIFAKTRLITMFNFSRRTKIITAFIAVIIVGYAIAEFWQSRNQIPEAFTAARSQGAIIAENIVNTSNQSTAELQQINQLDEQGKYSQALTLTNSLISQSETLRNQAVQLSAQVEDMTKSLSSINSFDEQQAALESIASQLALINQLVNYSGDLGHLSDVLQARFEGQPQPAGTVQGIVNQINTDVNAINNFNAQATQAMAQFDKIVEK